MKRRKFLENLSLVTSAATLTGTTPIKSTSTLKSKDQKKETSLLEIRVTAPSVVEVNEPFWLGVKLMGEPFFADWVPIWQRRGVTVNAPFNHSARGIRFMDNVLPSWKNEVEIHGDDGYEGLSTYSFQEGNGPYAGDHRPIRRLEGFRFTKPGIKFIKVKDPITGKIGTSNAICVTKEKPTQRLFWGNLHCHSIFGDGIRLPEEIHAFARDESFLDIFSLTDHTEALTNAQWNYFREVCNTFNEPGRYVTFNGGEWTSPEFGHRNFIYPGDEGPIIRCTDPNQNTLQKLYAVAREHKALLIANHTASEGHTTHWDNGHDAEVERLIEIYSIGGVNEMPKGPGNTFESRIIKDEVIGSHAVNGLKKGFKLGFIGTGDDHDGRPGDSIHHLQEKPESYKEILGPGLMGVWAEDLSRESIFEALWNRKVFGTTNNRTWLKFSINEQTMGSIFTADKKLSIKIEAASNLPILRIDLLKKGEVVQHTEPNQMQAIWEIEEKQPTNSTWYYARITMDEEHLAWSSPVWIES
jgi:hypothetical protein